ncbi:MAG TPA: hypothetical protein VII99_13960 [Bacteroidia bacterium]
MNFKIILLLFVLSANCFGQSKIIFEKKKNSARQLEIITPAYCDIFFSAGKVSGYISEMKDSFLVVRIFNPGKINNVKEKESEARKIMKDKALSARERENKLVKHIYLDSLILPVSAVKRMRFSSAQRRGKYFLVAAASFAAAVGMTELYSRWRTQPENRSNAAGAIALAAGFSLIYAADYNMFVKRISPRKWTIKK